MLAAHRNGGRTSLASFARAWDRYTRVRKPRPATEREIITLSTMLEASVALDEPGYTELAQAIAEHKQSQQAPARPARPTAPTSCAAGGLGLDAPLPPPRPVRAGRARAARHGARAGQARTSASSSTSSSIVSPGRMN